MSTVGQKEKQTQQRVVKLLREKLGYRYLGNWEELPNNRKIEPELLRAWLKQQGHSETLIGRVLYELDKAEGDTSKSLYDRNRTVYDLLRYGLKVKLEAGQNHVNVWLVDWQNPGINDFAVAEEVTVAAAHDTAHSKRLDIVLYVNGIALAVKQVFLDFVLSQLRHGRPLCWRRPRHRHRFRAHAHGLKVRSDFAMTGEITILGKVLQVGGIHQKLLAAYESGGKEVQIPPDNLSDTPFLPVVVNEKLTITPVHRVDQVLK